MMEALKSPDCITEEKQKNRISQTPQMRVLPGRAQIPPQPASPIQERPGNNKELEGFIHAFQKADTEKMKDVKEKAEALREEARLEALAGSRSRVSNTILISPQPTTTQPLQYEEEVLRQRVSITRIKESLITPAPQISQEEQILCTDLVSILDCLPESTTESDSELEAQNLIASQFSNIMYAPIMDLIYEIKQYKKEKRRFKIQICPDYILLWTERPKTKTQSPLLHKEEVLGERVQITQMGIALRSLISLAPNQNADKDKVRIEPSIEEVLREKYLILGLIGRGATANVLLAKDLKTGEVVALKVMSFQNGKSNPKAFAQELGYLSKLKHDNIVKVDAEKSFQNKKGAYLVMELADGENLSNRFDSGRTYSLKEAIQIVIVVLNVLKYLKSINVAHGDIKPDNIIKDVRNRIIILDFGISKNIDTEKEQEPDDICSGTPHFMAPEMIKDGIHKNSDIYNLGATLFHLLTGQHQHSGRNALSIFREKKEGKYLTFDDVQYPCPDLLKLLYERMMEHAPEERMDLDVLITGFQLLESSYNPDYDKEFEPPKSIPISITDETQKISLEDQERAVEAMEARNQAILDILLRNNDQGEADTEISIRINQQEQ